MLHLEFAQANNSPHMVSMLTPAQSLTSLVLDGDSTGWTFKQNDLHSPLLEELTLSLNKPVPFLEAIIAPKLRYVWCWISDPVEFDPIEGKFRDFYDLFLGFSYEVDNWGAESLCRAFPGVRCVHLSAWRPCFFMAGSIHESGVLERRPPIDQWLNLETVTLDGLSCQWLNHWEHDDPIVKSGSGTGSVQNYNCYIRMNPSLESPSYSCELSRGPFYEQLKTGRPEAFKTHLSCQMPHRLRG